jgi:hypothetical protein
MGDVDAGCGGGRCRGGFVVDRDAEVADQSRETVAVALSDRAELPVGVAAVDLHGDHSGLGAQVGDGELGRRGAAGSGDENCPKSLPDAADCVLADVNGRWRGRASGRPARNR